MAAKAAKGTRASGSSNAVWVNAAAAYNAARSAPLEIAKSSSERAYPAPAVGPGAVLPRIMFLGGGDMAFTSENGKLTRLELWRSAGSGESKKRGARRHLGGAVPDFGIGVLVHIAAGAVGLVAGAVALWAAKGQTLHRQAGMVFVAALAVMAITATVLAVLVEHWESVLVGALVLYFVVTAWEAAKGDGRAGPDVPWHIVFAIGLTIFGLMLAGGAGMSPSGLLNGYPPELYMIFAGVAGWAAMWDLTFLVHGQLSNRARLARHLWRMCLALAFMAAAFFLGQPEYFPESLRGTLLLAFPPLGALAAMVFWFAKVWLTKAFAQGSRT